MMRPLMLAAPILFACAAPVAALDCSASSSLGFGGMHISGNIHFGKPYTEAEQARLDEIQLRQRGVDVTRAERFAGCIRAWVRQADGSQSQQFFDPKTFLRLDPTTGQPYDLTLR